VVVVLNSMGTAIHLRWTVAPLARTLGRAELTPLAGGPLVR